MSATTAISNGDHTISISPVEDTGSVGDTPKVKLKIQSFRDLIKKGVQTASSAISAVKERIWKRLEVNTLANEAPEKNEVDACYQYVTTRWNTEHAGEERALTPEQGLKYLQEGIAQAKAKDLSKVSCYALNVAGHVQEVAKELEAKKEVFGLSELPEGLSEVRDLKQLFKILEDLPNGKTNEDMSAWRNVSFDCSKRYGMAFSGRVPQLEALNDLLRWTDASEKMKADPLNVAIESVRERFLDCFPKDLEAMVTLSASVPTASAKNEEEISEEELVSLGRASSVHAAELSPASRKEEVSAEELVTVSKSPKTVARTTEIPEASRVSVAASNDEESAIPVSTVLPSSTRRKDHLVIDTEEESVPLVPERTDHLVEDAEEESVPLVPERTDHLVEDAEEESVPLVPERTDHLVEDAEEESTPLASDSREKSYRLPEEEIRALDELQHPPFSGLEKKIRGLMNKIFKRNDAKTAASKSA